MSELCLSKFTFQHSCGGCKFCLWNLEGVDLIFTDELCVLVVQSQFSNYLAMESRGNRDGKDLKVQFDSKERDIVVSTQSGTILHVNQLQQTCIDAFFHPRGMGMEKLLTCVLRLQLMSQQYFTCIKFMSVVLFVKLCIYKSVNILYVLKRIPLSIVTRCRGQIGLVFHVGHSPTMLWWPTWKLNHCTSNPLGNIKILTLSNMIEPSLE